MSSLSTLSLVTSIFFVCLETSTSNTIRRDLTNYQLKVSFNSKEEFPHILPVLLERPNRTINFHFIRHDVNYNLPVYMRINNVKNVILDTPPIKNAAFYADERYDASVTLHCEENELLPSGPGSCKERLMSGFFYIDGYRHVIEPKKRIFKQFVIHFSRNSHKEFIYRHQVFKIYESDHICNLKFDNKSFKTISNKTVTSKTGTINNTKMNNIIEVVAIFTHKVPMDQAEIKEQKLYYIHVFGAVNLIYKRIKSKDMSFGVNLIGFQLEPDDTPLYVFPKGNRSAGYLDGNAVISAVAWMANKPPCDHIVMFSTHRLSENHNVIGLARLGTMCSQYSVSIMLKMETFREIFSVSHEIGHSLRCEHDGYSNNCSGKDAYVMSDTFRTTTAYMLRNHFLFSNCSLDYMTKFIKNLRNNCLLTSIKPPILPKLPTGQLFNVTDQCQAKTGRSKVCPTDENKSKFCISLWCIKNDDFCTRTTPALGTTCGNKKWCMFGQCVYDALAPPARENCLYGDRASIKLSLANGSTYSPETCDEILMKRPNFCQTKRKNLCCDTCYRRAHPGMTTPKWNLLPFTTSMGSTAASAAKIFFFLIAFAVLDLFQQLENHFAS